MELSFTTEAISTAILIFFLRVSNNAIGTVRVITLSRQQRGLTAFLGFFEALAFALTVAGVVTELTNVIILFSYCMGYSVGALLGMSLEKRFITTYMIVNVIAAEKGTEIATTLRDAGFGVTKTIGEGLHGEVVMLRSVINRRDVPKVLDIIHLENPKAFVEVEEARSVQRGFMRTRNQPSV